MRTREDYFISKTYLKENVNAEKPLYIWLSERLGKNLPMDEWQRPLLLKLLKTLIKDEQRALKGKKKKLPTSVAAPLNRPVSTASVDISPSSFPANSARVQAESKTLKNAYQNVYIPKTNTLLESLLQEAEALENKTFNPFNFVGQYVYAKHKIEDSPLADEDSSATKNAVGYVEDYDELSNLLYVDFGKGAIAVDPEEVSFAKSSKIKNK